MAIPNMVNRMADTLILFFLSIYKNYNLVGIGGGPSGMIAS